MRKKLSEITREQWIAFNWIDDSEMGEDERCFITVGHRTPDEAYQARQDWDSTAYERSIGIEG